MHVTFVNNAHFCFDLCMFFFQYNNRMRSTSGIFVFLNMLIVVRKIVFIGMCFNFFGARLVHI